MGSILLLIGASTALTAVTVLVLSGEGLAGADGGAWLLALTLVLASAWLGWVVRQAWSYPRRLQEAERRWAARAPLEAVESVLLRASLATGETGYRLGIMRGHSRLAAWDRPGAWDAYREAHLCRLPFWIRGPVRRFLGKHATPDRIPAGRRLLRFAPRMPHLHLAYALDLFGRGDGKGGREARKHLKLAMLHGSEDPLLLDMLLREAILAGPRPQDAGHPEPLSHRARRLLDLLLDRHGDPRLSWGRGLPAWRLVQEGDLEMALRVTRSLPFESRLDPLVWRAEIEALRRMGDEDEAWHLTEDALRFLPDSVHLWMTSLDQALVQKHNGDAERAAQRALDLWRRLGAAWDAQLHEEWLLLQAEYLFSNKGDAVGADARLQQLPVHLRESGDLDIEVDLALARYDKAYPKVQARLERHPGDLGLLILKGECFAAMSEWGSLLQFLEGLAPDARNEAAFWHLSGLAKAHRDDPSGAKLDLERATSMEPGELRYVLDAGHASMELGDWARAEHHWRQALKQDERNAEALFQLAEARDALHDREGARRYLRECLTHHPEDPDAQAFLSNLESN